MISASNVEQALTEWKPGITMFVVMTADDLDRIRETLTVQQRDRLERLDVSVLPIKLDPGTEGRL